MYKKAVASLICLIKQSRPDILNVFRELGKCLWGASKIAIKEELLGQKSNLLGKIKPIMEFNFLNLGVSYSGSDWARDKYTHKSVSGYIMYLLNVAILWNTKIQWTAALSSNKVECNAFSEAAKEIKILVQVMQSLNTKIVIPIFLRVDNFGTSFMAKYIKATSRKI